MRADSSRHNFLAANSLLVAIGELLFSERLKGKLQFSFNDDGQRVSRFRYSIATALIPHIERRGMYLWASCR